MNSQNVRLYVSEVRVEVENAPLSVLHGLDKILSAPLAGSYYIKKARPSFDGKCHLFKHKSFPVGLIGLVVNYFKAAKIPFSVIDMRRKVSFEPITIDTLRDYQKQALEKALRLRMGIIQHPTGSGKTMVIAALFDAFRNSVRLYISHRLDLAAQTCAQLKKIGVITDGSILAEGNTAFTNCNFATFQTTRKLLKSPEGLEFLSRVDLLCVDEVHCLPADTFYTLAMNIYAPYRFGFSATPEHDDPARNLKLMGAVGPIIDFVPFDELTERNYLARPRTLFIKLDVPTIEPLSNSYEDHYVQALVNCEERNNAIVELSRAAAEAGHKVLVLVKRLEHGKMLAKRLNTLFLSGVSDLKLRRQSVEEFETGSRNLLVASTIFDEGINIEKISTLIIAGGGASSLRALQRAGRGLRPAPGKKEVFIVDFLDNQNYLLRKHSRKRRKIYQEVFGIEDVYLNEALEQISGKKNDILPAEN